MSFIDDMSDTARKVFLAGVGAVAMSAEKSSQLIDDLVKKGEITVEQGKALNEELKHKASSVSSDTEASILRGRMRVMTPEEREAYAAKVSQIKDDLNAEPVEVEAEPVEEAEDVEPEAADEPKDDAE
ncbi:MAG: phasin family protein [Olegusella sp.]|nr:phasin family protein [Olegusella sp.]